MAELLFDYLFNYKSTASKVNISTEADNTLGKFFIEEERQGNDLATVTNGNFNSVKWGDASNLLTSQNIINIGIKSFPQVGAIGFYTLKYQEKSVIIAPIFNGNKRYNAPVLAIEQKPSTFVATLVDPEGVTFECYRIVVRLDYATEEYITYSKVIELPLPSTPGTYEVHAVGYVEEIEASRESNIIQLVVA